MKTKMIALASLLVLAGCQGQTTTAPKNTPSPIPTVATQVENPSPQETVLPDDSEAAKWLQKANFAKGSENYSEAEELYSKAAMSDPENSEIAFWQACNYSLWGKNTEAVSSLRKAMEMGFTDLSLVESQLDLDPIRDLPEYEELMKAWKDKQKDGRE